MPPTDGQEDRLARPDHAFENRRRFGGAIARRQRFVAPVGKAMAAVAHPRKGPGRRHADSLAAHDLYEQIVRQIMVPGRQRPFGTEPEKAVADLARLQEVDRRQIVPQRRERRRVGAAVIGGEINIVACLVPPQPVDQLAEPQHPPMGVLGEFIIGVAVAPHLRLDRRSACDRRKMIERPARQGGPMIDEAGQFHRTVRIIIAAIEVSSGDAVGGIEHEAAFALARKPRLIGEQPLLLGAARRLPPQRKRHRVFGQPLDLIFRRSRRHARGDQPRMQRRIIVARGQPVGEDKALVGLGHRTTPKGDCAHPMIANASVSRRRVYRRAAAGSSPVAPSAGSFGGSAGVKLPFSISHCG